MKRSHLRRNFDLKQLIETHKSVSNFNRGGVQFLLGRVTLTLRSNFYSEGQLSTHKRNSTLRNDFDFLGSRKSHYGVSFNHRGSFSHKEKICKSSFNFGIQRVLLVDRPFQIIPCKCLILYEYVTVILACLSSNGLIVSLFHCTAIPQTARTPPPQKNKKRCF